MTAAKTNEYRLQYPIEYEGQTIEAVTLRRAKGKDIERMAAAEKRGGEALVMIETIACLADLPADAVREMDGEDFTTLMEMAPDFLPRERAAFPKTGGA